MKRSDQALAIYGVLALSVVGLLGYIALAAMGREPDDALLAVVVASGVGGVLGWARGGTYYQDTPEIVPSSAQRSSYDGATPEQMRDMVA